ncbi:MAG: hypothetical protein V4729_06660 [Pseudomonadota bacterium]
MNLSDLEMRAKQLIELGEKTLATKKSNPQMGSSVDAGLQQEFRSSALSFIDRVFGREHPHYTEFFRVVDGNWPSDTEKGIAIIRAIKSEICGGWLFSVKGLVAAEVFADFLEMASHFLDSGYKDAAAVMVGSTLEEHIRQLCIKNGLDVHEEKDGNPVAKKADRLNSELAAKNIYSKLDQKVVTAWLDIRNKAAHGKYGEYNLAQVQQMYAGVAEFMARVRL